MGHDVFAYHSLRPTIESVSRLSPQFHRIQMPRRKSGEDMFARLVAKEATKLARESTREPNSSEEAERVVQETVRDFVAAVRSGIAASGDDSADAMDLKTRSLLRRARAGRQGFERRLRSIWKDGFDRLEVLIGFYTEIGEHFLRDGMALGQKDTARFRALVELHARGARVAREIFCLMQAGFGDGAFARWRTLYELSVVTRFIAKHGEDVASRYLQHIAIRSAKAARQFNEHATAIGWERESAHVVAQLASRSQDVADRFGDDFGNEYGWASKVLGNRKPNFAVLARDIGWDHWRPFYSWASGGVHAGPDGLLPMGAKGHGSDYLLVGASNAGLADPGQFTALALAQILRSLNLQGQRMDYESFIVTIDALVVRCQAALIAANREVEARSTRSTTGTNES
jgi:hypothetical protein